MRQKTIWGVFLMVGFYSVSCVHSSRKRNMREVIDIRQQDSTDYFKLARETKDAFKIYSQERAIENLDTETTKKLDQVAENYDNITDEQVAEIMENTYGESKSSFTTKQGAGVALIVIGAGLGAVGIQGSVKALKKGQEDKKAYNQKIERLKGRKDQIEEDYKVREEELIREFKNINDKLEKVSKEKNKDTSYRVDEKDQHEVKYFFKEKYDMKVDFSQGRDLMIEGHYQVKIKNIKLDGSKLIYQTENFMGENDKPKELNFKAYTEKLNQIKAIKPPDEIPPAKFPKHFVATGVVGMGVAVVGALMAAENSIFGLVGSSGCKEGPAVCNLMARLSKIAP